MVSVDIEYISAACNSTPNALDWGDCGRLCFGSCRSLAVAESASDGSSCVIRRTLSHHGGDVIACRWMRRLPAGVCSRLLVTGSADGTAALWAPAGGDAPLHQLRGHQKPVTLVDAVCTGEQQQEQRYVATASGDHTVRVWRQNCDDAEPPVCQQTLQLDDSLAVALHLTLLPGCRTPCLLLAMDDSSVRLLVCTDGQYTCALRLTGHQDWVRSIDSVRLDDTADSALLLATAGQDTTIRVWRVTADTPSNSAGGDAPIRLKTQSVTAPDGQRPLSVCLDSVLAGHDGWVYGVRWRPDASPPTLASASLDKCLLVWQPAGDAGVWVERARLGAVGGSTLGLYGCAWGPHGWLAAHGFRGALHLWRPRPDADGAWDAVPAPGGHSAAVTDLSWSRRGQYLLSCSLDQTTRLHGRWRHAAGTWHEMSRPQIHGYDMFCVATLADGQFASGGEEKVARAFHMPTSVADNLQRLLGESVMVSTPDSVAEGAALPSLGLTNKPVFQDDGQEGMVTTSAQSAESYFIRTELSAPPTEETLLQNTLWPETRKLYGHGYELMTAAGDRAGQLLVTACRAAQPQHTCLLVWRVSDWQLLQRLDGGHQLTVVQLAFSPDDGWLLAASRDRSWSVYARRPDGEGLEVRARCAAAHSRVIWCCAWLPDSGGFVTGSRDRQLVTWRRSVFDGREWTRVGEPVRANAPVTAVAVSSCQLLALGLETGAVQLLRAAGPGLWTPLLTLSHAHQLAVKRLQFRPRPADDDQTTLLLASCSTDRTLKIHAVRLLSPDDTLLSI